MAALVADDPSKGVEEALDLVEALLEPARDEPRERTFSSVVEGLDEAVDAVRGNVEVTADLAATMQLPPGPLLVICEIFSRTPLRRGPACPRDRGAVSALVAARRR